MTEDDYLIKLGEFVNHYNDKTYKAQRDVLANEMIEFEKTVPVYEIYCVKDCYVGQGIDYQVGQVFCRTRLTKTNEGWIKMLEMLNSSPWCKDCWAVKILPPDENLHYKI